MTKTKKALNIFIILSIITLIGCNSNDEDNLQNIDAPSIAQVTITDINGTSVTLTSEVLHDNGSPIIEKGFCWSTSPNPDINSDKIISGNGLLGEFSSVIEGINLNTQYYVKSYAINEVGIEYSEEQTFTTLNRIVLQIDRNMVDQRILYNKQDKLIYFISFNMDNIGNRSDFKINAFNYDLKKITSQREIEHGFFPLTSINSVGIYNNQVEIYLLFGNKLTILNPIDLTELTSFTIPTSDVLSSVKIRDGLLFISHQRISNTFISVYNREDFTLISEAGNPSTNPNYGYLIVYKDIANENQIKCASFQSQSSLSNFTEYTFDNQGNYLDFNLGTNGFRSLVRTNDNVDFILTSRYGVIHQKSNLYIHPANQPKLNEAGELKDYFISENGAYIFSIQNNSSINRYNASTFILEESIPINENWAKKIVVDENQLIIFDYDLLSPNEVVFSFYEN